MKDSFTVETITPENYKQALYDPDTIADFLHEHLDHFRDPKDQIMNCLEYALGIIENRRGFILVAREKDTSQDVGENPGNNKKNILGVTVMCETGMSGYIPENILVYIAVDAAARGRGIGKVLMEQAIQKADGDIALHVEPDNPARRLYERIGFTNKYLEMRLKK